MKCEKLGSTLELHGLRTLDSLQLATFLNYCEKEQDGFVCADKKFSQSLNMKMSRWFMYEKQGCF
jgi:hypothetical protein